jgi:4-azaleucine resistance transporter AzlC
MNEEITSGNQTGSHPSDTSTVSFEYSGIRAGFIHGLPIALGVGGYGIAFGILASQAGLSVAEAAFMSATVFAGAAQLVAAQLWADPIPVLAVIAATTMVNLRFSLMSAALQPWFKDLTRPQAYGSLLFIGDENWALTMSDLKSGSGRGAFLLGCGFCVWIAWVAATVLGVFAGNVIHDPSAYGIDFIFVAVFVALAVSLWEGQQSLVPWVTALVVALVTAQLVSGKWYILAGGIAAGVVEVVRYE